jgi:hypothetical protein
VALDDVAADRASEERSSVSIIAWAEKLPPSTPVAVRHTPLTAIESPSASSPARRLEMLTTAPSPSRSISRTLPRSAMRPVNMRSEPRSPLAQAGADEQVLADRLALEGQGAERLGDAIDAFALQRIARGAPAQQQRGQE